MKIVNITSQNMEEFDHCLMKNKKLPGYIAKSDWMKKRFKEGLIVKRVINDKNEVMGFIEYIPIEKAWRAVTGSGYLFIHCVFTYPKKFQGNGVANLLINDAIRESKKQRLNGVAVMTSKGSFMADQRVFEKSGFNLCVKEGNDQLLVFKNKKTAAAPKFFDIKNEQEKYKGIHVFYSYQCPALAKPVSEIKDECKSNGIEVKFHEIKTCKEAQKTPFLSGTFGVVCDGKVYAERVVSKTRFLNIVKGKSQVFPN